MADDDIESGTFDGGHEMEWLSSKFGKLERQMGVLRLVARPASQQVHKTEDSYKGVVDRVTG